MTSVLAQKVLRTFGMFTIFEVVEAERMFGGISCHCSVFGDLACSITNSSKLCERATPRIAPIYEYAKYH